MSEYKLHLGDCLEFMKSMPDKSVDAVITDPPYGIAGGRGQKNRERAKSDYGNLFEDSPEYIRDFVVPAITECVRISGCVIVTPGNKNFSLYPQPDSFGCFFQPASVGLQVFGYADAQPIFYYGKNATKKNLGKRCSYQLTESPEENGHPCPKPIIAWKKLVENNTLPGHTIFDPFMGSGTTGVACMKLNRNFIGCEIDPAYYAISEKRIAEAASQLILL